MDCDECGWPAGRFCRDFEGDGKPMPMVCHPFRFVEAGVEPGAA